MMKSYWLKTPELAQGTETTLELRDTPVPDPGPHQLLVRVRAAGLNRGEFLKGGLHKPGAVKAVGTEAAGEVVRAGAEVKNFVVGDRVMGRMAGAFAEYALVDTTEAMPMPERLSWEEAASIPLTFHVVYDMLVLQGNLKAGEWLMITGVSSGVGVAAVQMAKALGAKVIGTSGSADKLKRMKAMGLDVGLCTRAPDFATRVMQATGGHGADLVINTVGGTVFAESMRCMAFEGRLAMVGYVDGVTHSDIDLTLLHTNRLRLFGVSNKLRTPAQRMQAVPQFIADMLPRIADGSVKPMLDKIFPFEQLAEAKAHMEANQHLGKIVLAGVPRI
jgi:NADPH:quinone reductase-like Zn-dependent oxidoreductase